VKTSKNKHLLVIRVGAERAQSEHQKSEADDNGLSHEDILDRIDKMFRIISEAIL
jgi:hypothetical protein